jgi:hypothetical protein
MGLPESAEVGHAHAHAHAHASEVHNTLSLHGTFWDLAIESAPALLLAYALAGVMRMVLRPAAIAWLSKGGSLRQGLKGVLFGLPMPICTCGVLPLYETLVRRGIPPTAGVAFLLATPELGLDAVLISLPLLGESLTLTRVLAAILVSLITAWIVGGMLEKKNALSETKPDDHTEEVERIGLREALRYGFVDLVDHTLPWVVAGLAVAALAEPILATETFAQLPSWSHIPIFAALGIPLYVCASGATPLAAIAIHQGVTAGAALAFLLTGPATNATTFGVLSQLHGRRVALMFGAVVTGLAIISGIIVDATLTPTLAAAATAHNEHHSPLNLIALGALSLLLLGSLWRHGVRGLIAGVLRPMLQS